MSCRLLRDADNPPATPLFEPQPGIGAQRAQVQPWPASNDAPPDHADQELARLRKRVVELELAVSRAAEEARITALREGEVLGFERASTAARPVLDRMTAAVADISRLRAGIRAEAERDLVALSLAIARRILRREVSVDPDAVHGLVRAALEKLQARDVTRIRVCPDHEDAVRRSLVAAHAGAVDLTADPALAPGDIVIETTRGNLDASIDTQLSEIERGFADRLR